MGTAAPTSISISALATSPSRTVGVIVVVTPAGSPETASVTGFENPGVRERLTVTVPDPPWAIVTVDGDTAIEMAPEGSVSSSQASRARVATAASKRGVRRRKDEFM